MTTETEPPPSVLTDRQRTAAIDRAYAEGLTCVCGTAADDDQLATWARQVTWDPEPLLWHCGHVDCLEGDDA